MQRKSFDAKYDETDAGEFTAYASTFWGEPDSYGDIVAPGAFSKTIQEWTDSGHPIPLLFGHRTDDPRMNIGAVIDATEDEHGLRIRAKFDDESEIAQYTRKLVKEGRLSKLSFSYDTRDSASVVLADGRHVRELRDIKLYEISLVPIPANPETEVIEAKSLGITPEELRAMGEDAEAPHSDEVKTDAADSEVPAEELVDTTESGAEEKAADTLDAETKSALLDIVAVMDLAWAHAVESRDDILEDRLGIKAEHPEEKSPDALADALATIMTLADRLDSIAEMIDDMAKRIAALSDTPAVDEGKNQEDIESKQAEAADDDADDNEEDPKAGNSEVEAKKNATLARMARYIRIMED